MANKVDKSYRDLQAEVRKQTGIIFPVSIVVLWKEFGWREKRIAKLLEQVKKVLDEIGTDGRGRSPIQVLDEETGIEMKLDGENRSYTEKSYLYSERWKRDKHRLSAAQIIYANQQQKKFVAPNLLSTFCVALHRHYGFGFERLSRFMAQADDLRREYGEQPDNYSELFNKTTGMELKKMPFYSGKGMNKNERHTVQ